MVSYSSSNSLNPHPRLLYHDRDFNAPPIPSRPADSSAATIAATGLLLLSQMEMTLSPPNITGAELWSNAAIDVSPCFVISIGMLVRLFFL